MNALSIYLKSRHYICGIHTFSKLFQINTPFSFDFDQALGMQAV